MSDDLEVPTGTYVNFLSSEVRMFLSSIVDKEGACDKVIEYSSEEGAGCVHIQDGALSNSHSYGGNMDMQLTKNSINVPSRENYSTTCTNSQNQDSALQHSQQGGQQAGQLPVELADPLIESPKGNIERPCGDKPKRSRHAIRQKKIRKIIKQKKRAGFPRRKFVTYNSLLKKLTRCPRKLSEDVNLKNGDGNIDWDYYFFGEFDQE